MSNKHYPLKLNSKDIEVIKRLGRRSNSLGTLYEVLKFDEDGKPYVEEIGAWEYCASLREKDVSPRLRGRLKWKLLQFRKQIS